MIKEVTYKEPSGYFIPETFETVREYDLKLSIDSNISYEYVTEIARQHKDNIDNCN